MAHLVGMGYLHTMYGMRPGAKLVAAMAMRFYFTYLLCCRVEYYLVIE